MATETKIRMCQNCGHMVEHWPCICGYASFAARSVPARVTMTVRETAAKLGVGMYIVRQRIKDGTLESVKCGQRQLVLCASLEAWMAQKGGRLS